MLRPKPDTEALTRGPRPRGAPVLLLAASLAAGVGCSSGFEERRTQLRFDPAANDFWALPFPSDLARRPDGTAGLVRWPSYGDPRSPLARTNALVGMWLEAADDRTRGGFGLSSGVFLATTGALAPGSLPATPAASLAPEATAYLVDVDPASPERGKRRPIEFSFRADGDRYAPPNLIAAVQVLGFPRRPNTRYALVVTDGVKDAAGEPLGRSRAFHDAMEGTGDARAAAALAPMKDTLRGLGVDLGRVVGAAAFTTGDPEVNVRKLVDWTERLPAPELKAPWTVAEDYPDYQVLTSQYEVPVIQTGARPYKEAGEGRIVFGPDGDPVIQSTQRVRLVVSVPKRPQPAGGFPLTMYLHGSGGEWYEGIDRGPERLDQRPGMRDEAPKGTGPAQWLARRGLALAGFDFPLHGNRHNPPDTTGLVYYNLFGNTQATIDNFSIATMELLILSRLLTSVTIDAALAPTLDAGGAADGKIRFDAARLTAMGHSMGATLGSAWVGFDPRVKAFYASGSGGSLIGVAAGATYPVILHSFLEGLVEFEPEKDLTLDHPLLHAFQHVWDWVDPTVRAHHVVNEPAAGFGKHILVTLGFRDGYFPPVAQASLATALGVPMVGEPVEPLVAGRLELAGTAPTTYPVSGNLKGGVTGAIVPFAVPNELGHYVGFDLEAARMQYTCFLASVGPTGARIPAAGPEDAPCP